MVMLQTSIVTLCTSIKRNNTFTTHKLGSWVFAVLAVAVSQVAPTCRLSAAPEWITARSRLPDRTSTTAVAHSS
ncbi:unnamed protein product [Leptidea sinapis]|uniref:Uncharacterized protein n=1 Tax=Leptidea sinapis TaxID=189913 RepID=A0A5E4PWA2_9NEOP|nr:unnamed protein product [Leptidea sinapis]